MKKLFTAILPAVLLLSTDAATAQSNNAQPLDGKMMKFNVAAGPEANVFYVPATGKTNDVLIIFHDRLGLTENAKTEARNWQKQLDGKVDIYEVDLYDGKTATASFEGDKLVSNLDAGRANGIIKGLLQKIGSRKHIATLGWGIGGDWAFDAAIMAGKESVGCVMYYAYPVIKDDARIAAFKSDVLFLYGNYDKNISKADMLAFGKKLQDDGRGFAYETFSGDNGFANIGNPSWKKTETWETEHMTEQFLKHKFGLDQQ